MEKKVSNNTWNKKLKRHKEPKSFLSVHLSEYWFSLTVYRENNSYSLVCHECSYTPFDVRNGIWNPDRTIPGIETMWLACAEANF